MFAGGRDRRGSTIQSLTVPDRENCMYKSTETESCLGRTETQLEGFDLKERGVAGEVSKAEWTIIRSLIFFFLHIMGAAGGFSGGELQSGFLVCNHRPGCPMENTWREASGRGGCRKPWSLRLECDSGDGENKIKTG